MASMYKQHWLLIVFFYNALAAGRFKVFVLCWGDWDTSKHMFNMTGQENKVLLC